MVAVHLNWRLVLVAFAAVALSVGVLPTVAGAEEARETRSDIVIRSNVEFDDVHGVRSGSGTVTDPYVISGWEVRNITIKDTSAPVLITDNTITGRLTLDWIGRHADVIGNDIADMRVNQNVRRTGLPTSGRIANNTFDVVGQLRHFDGVFEENVVGQPMVGDVDKVYGEIFTDRAVNFDGFNGARFRNNEIFGYVEVRLHGHHHSSAWGEDSHQHTGTDTMDHSTRYHEVWVTGNTIIVPPGSYRALEYVDNNHAGNDRTATSETNPALNDPHVHYTRVHLTDNLLVGGGLSVNIFNASDERHLRTATGRLDIDNNMIHLEESMLPFRSSGSGISVRNATDVDVFIRGNEIEGPHDDSLLSEFTFSGSGIDLSQLKAASVRVYDNKVSNLGYGVYAYSFADSRWFIDGLWTNLVDEPVVYNTGVPAPEPRSADPAPEGTPPPTTDHGGHRH